MLFSSINFIFYFLPIVLLAYALAPKKIKNFVLLIASLIFYSWGEPIYVFLMLFSAVFNYFMAVDIALAKIRKKYNQAKFNLIFTVAVNLFILSFFKYYGFLMDTINNIFNSDIHYTALALPIGISFYTFQALSYIIDVYRGTVKVQTNIINFSLYLALFPQLIAGPIVKYKDIVLQLDDRRITLEKFGQGTIRFILGLGKKVILANNLGFLYQTVISTDSSSISTLAYWIGIIAYTLQIYFDFSGYSDMAIGLGKMFGFDFMENFNYPYISKSITEFWRRWHISLSTWFREYLYIPLGGNRVSYARHILNLLIVWSLTGLWHGASWNFIVWGIYYGILLILEKYVWGERLETLPSYVMHIYTLLIVMIGWVFFSSADLGTAISYIKILFGFGNYPFINTYCIYLMRTNIIMLAIGAIISSGIINEHFKTLCKKNTPIGVFLIFGVLILSTAYLIFSSYNPFLYFRF